MTPIYFPAYLKSERGEILEIGEACVSDTKNEAEFVNEFVPLIKMGTPATIVRFLGEKELECLHGRVYLSSRTLLRIVDVDEYVIDEMRRLFSVNENISADIYVSSKPVHFSALQKMEYTPGTIRYVSRDIFKICTLEYVAEGSFLTFSTGGPGVALDNLVVRVTERVLLRRSSAILICEVYKPTHENSAALRAYETLKRQRAGLV